MAGTSAAPNRQIPGNWGEPCGSNVSGCASSSATDPGSPPGRPRPSWPTLATGSTCSHPTRCAWPALLRSAGVRTAVPPFTPLAMAAVATLVQPASWHWFVGGSVRSYALTGRVALAAGARSSGLTVVSFPAAQLLVIAILGGAAGVIAAIRPARRAARLPVLRAIAAE